MFAPKVAKAQAKVTKPQMQAANPISKPTQAPHCQRTIGNQAALRLLAQQTSRPVESALPASAAGRVQRDFATVLPEGDDVPYATQASSGTSGTGQAPASGVDWCTPTAQFTNIPSGSLPVSLKGDIFGAPFHIEGTFSTKIPCTCVCGEYRQFIRGTITRNGTPMVHPLCSVNMDPTTWHEDCAGNPLGHRSNPGSKFDIFTDPDRPTGCTYKGFDWPGFRLSKFNKGDVLAQDTQFRGELVDACNNDNVLAASAWSVTGSITVP